MSEANAQETEGNKQTFPASVWFVRVHTYTTVFARRSVVRGVDRCRWKPHGDRDERPVCAAKAPVKGAKIVAAFGVPSPPRSFSGDLSRAGRERDGVLRVPSQHVDHGVKIHLQYFVCMALAHAELSLERLHAVVVRQVADAQSKACFARCVARSRCPVPCHDIWVRRDKSVQLIEIGLVHPVGLPEDAVATVVHVPVPVSMLLAPHIDWHSKKTGRSGCGQDRGGKGGEKKKGGKKYAPPEEALHRRADFISR
jgi:hypothetical protein